MVGGWHKKKPFVLIGGFVGLLTVFAWAAQSQTGVLFVENDRVGIGTSTPSTKLDVQEADAAIGSSNSVKVLVRNTASNVGNREMFEIRNNGGAFFIVKDDSTNSSYSFANFGGDFIISQQQNPGVEFRLTQTGNLTISGTLTQSSSRYVKDNIEALDGREILAKVVDLPLAKWSYQGQDARHLGPMAEDFHASFGLGDTDKGLTTIDVSGVALASIKGLHEMVQEKDERIVELEERIQALEKLVFTSNVSR